MSVYSIFGNNKSILKYETVEFVSFFLSDLYLVLMSDHNFRYYYSFNHGFSMRRHIHTRTAERDNTSMIVSVKTTIS